MGTPAVVTPPVDAVFPAVDGSAPSLFPAGRHPIDNPKLMTDTQTLNRLTQFSLWAIINPHSLRIILRTPRVFNHNCSTSFWICLTQRLCSHQFTQ